MLHMMMMVNNNVGRLMLAKTMIETTMIVLAAGDPRGTEGGQLQWLTVSFKANLLH